MKEITQFVLEGESPTLMVTYSSTDSWKPPIHVSDWLIFYCGNLILHQKKKVDDENINFLMKNNK